MKESKPQKQETSNEEKQPRSRGGNVLAYVLVILGFLFLLQNIGYLSLDLGRLIEKFWPVILILVGLKMMR